MKPISVSVLNTQIKTLLETTFLEVCVEGEISNYTLHKASGHLYFSLKDDTSAIRCVMFKSNTKTLSFIPKNGMHILAQGVLSVYVPRGEYQIICHNLQEEGQGSLATRYETLKKRLESKGYFANKKPLPLFPKRIALITSLNGAALKDMLKVTQSRWNLVQLVAIDTLVQGEKAKDSIAQNIVYADSFFGTTNAFDIIVIARGGGSTEDLWAFNEECVADTIYNARTPIVSAVGHEIDFVISDFVSDVRAPTPSACMEMILPDSKEWLLRTDDMIDELQQVFLRTLEILQQEIQHLTEIYQSISYDTRLQLFDSQIVQCKELLETNFWYFLAQQQETLNALASHLILEPYFRDKTLTLCALQRELEALNPSHKARKTYAQILHNGKPTQLKELDVGAEIELYDGVCEAKATIHTMSQT